jgi:KaiC/GvpD/RAD55 family RecA-like ATPase
LIYGFAGEFGAGKSMFAIQCAVKAAAEGWRVIYIETEGALNIQLFERIAKRFGADLNSLVDKLTITQATDALDVKEILLSLFKQPEDSRRHRLLRESRVAGAVPGEGEACGASAVPRLPPRHLAPHG